MGSSLALPQMLLEWNEHLAQGNKCSKLIPVVREAARLLEALRLALQAGDTEDYESLTDGEIAIVRSNQTIASKLDEMIAMMKEDREDRQTVEPTG